jgi:hypothetical protein
MEVTQARNMTQQMHTAEIYLSSTQTMRALISLNKNSLICALNPGAFERIIIQFVNTKL